MTAAAPVAAWPLPSLLTSLGRAGWGDLAGRSYHGTRAVLDGLHKLLPHGSAAGLATVAQVADASGYSKRWVEQKLYELEDMGLIEWRRGGIAYGKPRPSWFKVVKSKLVDLIYAARPALTKRLEARQRATAARLAGLPPFLRTRTGRKRRSAHVELSSTSSPYGRDRDGPLTVKGTSHSCNCCIEGWIDLPEGSAHCPTCRPKAAARWRQRARAS